MPDSALITVIDVDAGPALKGIDSFVQGAGKVVTASQAATASVDKLGASLDAVGAAGARAGAQTGAMAPSVAALTREIQAQEQALLRTAAAQAAQSGMSRYIDDISKAQVALRQIGVAHEEVMRKVQNTVGSGFAVPPFSPFPQNSFARAAQAGQITAAPLERAGIDAAIIAPVVGTVLTEAAAHHPTEVQRLVRTVDQAALSDPTIPILRAREHAAEAAVAPGIVGPAAQTSSIALASTAQRVETGFQPLAEAAVPSAALAGISREVAKTQTITERAAHGAASAMEGAFATPASIKSLGRDVADIQTIAERAAHGATTAMGVAFATPTSLKSLGRDVAGIPAIAERAAVAAAGGQIDVGAWLQARKPPNEVDAEAWNKARQGTESFWGSLKNLFTGARAGAGDLHGAAAATEELATAHGHATGTSSRMREALVLVHEFLRGDWKRGVGSATIELQNFGLLGYIFNPITLGLTATAGAMAYLAYKSSEIEANLRSFSATIKVMGDGSLTGAADLEKFTEQLKHTGVAGDAAKKTIEEIARSGFVRPGQSTADFAALARDISQYNGAGAAGTPAAAEELLKAFGGGTESALKFAESLHALSAPQIAQIHDLDQHAKSAEALRLIYVALRSTIPSFTDELSPLGKAFLELTTAWDEFTTSLSKSEFPSLITSQIKAMLGDAKELISSIEGLAHLVGSVKAAITGGAERDKLFPQYGPGSGNTEPYAEAPIPPRTTAPATIPSQEQVGNYLTGPSIGFTPSQSAAVIGQARQESSLNPAAGLGTAHQGMFQWDSTRWAQMLAWAQLNNLDPMDYRTQLQFAKGEIQTKAPAFFSAKTLGEQTSILTKQFEVSGNYDTEIPKRQTLAEQALGTSTTPFHPTEHQTAAIDLQNQKLKEQLGISSQIAGVDREAVQERVRLQQEAAKETFFGDSKKFIDEGMIGFFRNRQALFESQHRLNDQEISDTEKIAQGYQKSAVEGLRAETLIQAQQQIREKGGAPSEVAIAQRDIINQRAASAISASRQQSILAEPAIAAAEGLARASFVSRAEEEKVKVANEAALQTQNVLNIALLQGSDAYIKEATAIDANARAQFRRRDAAAQGLEAGHQIQANTNQTQVLALELSLQGQSNDAIRTQVDLLRARQDIEQRYQALSQTERDAIFANTAGVILTNAALVQAVEQTHRVEEAFRSIAGTIDNELGGAIKNALMRTPLEAGQHLKHYWDDFRAGLKQVAAEMVSTFANLAFLRPAIGTAAGALGLGQVAQQYGTFGGLFTGAGGGAASPGTGPSGTNLSGSQLAFNVSGLASGSTLLGPAQGGIVNQSGNITTVLGGASGAAPTTQEVAATGTAGLSPDQIQALLNAGTTAPATPTQTSAAPLEAFLGTITSVPGAAAQPIAPAATEAAAGSTSPGVFFIPGTETPIAGPTSLAPQPILPEAAALATGVPVQNAVSATTPAASLLNPGNLPSAASAAGTIGSLLSQPGLLPNFLSGSGGGGIGGLFNSIGPALGFANANAPFVTATGLFGATTLGSALTGAGAGFGAGTLLNNVLGGNPVGGAVGSGAGGLLGALLGTISLPIIGPLGTLLGGLIGGAGGGVLGGLFGGPPRGQSAGAVVGANGQVSFNDAGGSAANIQTSDQISQQISGFVRALGQLTNAQGQPIGNISTNAVVSSDNRSGIKVTGTNIAGGNFGQNAADAVTQTELQIIHSLTNVSGTLQTVLKNINDPAQLQNAVQFVDIYDKLNVTSAQLTASLNGNVDAIGPFSQALTQVNTTFAQLTSQAQQFGVSTAPISTALAAVTATLSQDFKINVAEALSTAIDGGNDFIASLVKIHQTYQQNINDAQALATGVPTGVTPGFAGGTMGSAGGTPAGWILVGERGPEWMFQPGGATVLPNGQQPSDVPNPLGRSFAEGIGAGDVAGQVPGIGSLISEASGGPSLLGAAGGVLGISSGTLSTIGDVLPIAGPIIGGVLGAVTGHPVQGAIGTAASLLGFALGGPVGGVIGGLVGLLGNFIGPKPSNNASGDLIDLSSGAISGFQSAGDKNADTIVAQISAGISAVTKTFQAATGGSISGAVNVQDGKRDGIKTSYAGPLGNVDAKWGSVTDAISQFALAIAHDLTGVDPALQAQLDATNDPNALIPLIEQATGKSIDLNSGTVTGPTAPATSPDATAAPTTPIAASVAPPPPPTLQQIYDSVVGSDTANFNNDTGVQNKANLVALMTAYGALSPDQKAKYDALVSGDPGTWNNTPTGIQAKLNLVSLEAGSFSGDLTPRIDNVVAQYNALPAYASGTTATPPGWILVGEEGPEWLHQAGGATVLPNGIQPGEAVSPIGRSFAVGTDLSTPQQINAAISATEQAQAGPVLASLGLDQLTTVIQNLASVAPEIATMAQNLIGSGNALPDILTQGIQALTDPLDLAIEKEKALGQERVAVATQTGQDLVKVEQLTAASLVQAVLNNLGNTNALNAIVYPGNTKALEYLQAAPTLAGLSGQQLTALASSIGSVAPDLASLAHSFIDTGTALPDTITQALEGIVTPLKLALQQQAAQAQARTQVADVTGQNFAQVAALNSASVIQAVISNISNPQALQALVSNGNPRGLEQLQAGPVIAGLGTDQLSALLTAIGNAAPDLTNMINALADSGRALPPALVQATQAITQAGLLTIEKAQALGFEQVQGAAATGQSVPQAQQLAAAETAQAVAQATNTQLPINGLPDWVTQLEEAVTAPLQLAIQKERAAGAERVQIAQASGADLVRVQQANADAIAQIWYQATQQLTSLKNSLTTGSLSGLTAANQVTASIEQFNTVLGLVQGGNTNFINELSTAGQTAVQAAQQAYGNGPQTASVREQVFQAITPFLVSASGYPTSGATAIAAGATTSSTATGTTTDLQANTTALQSLTTAITSTLGSSGAVTDGSGGGSVSGAAPAGGTGGAAPSTAATNTAGFSPNLTPSLDNLMSQYNALSPAMQAVYNGVVGSDNATFNNGAGLGNKVELAALLTGYQGLSPAASAQYDAAVSNNPAYSNTASGIATKLSLVESLYPPIPAAVTPVTATGAAASTPANLNLTSNPVTGQSFTGSGITAVTPNFPTFPSASSLSNALANAIASRATAADWATINQALQAGILDPTKQPGYALVIKQAQQFAAGQAIDPSAGLAQALSDAVHGTPTLQEWALINQAVNAGILSPTAQPQYATIIQQARRIANAQATSLSAIPNPQTAYSTVINGLPAFADGTMGTPEGAILVGERGPEWMRPANDNQWSQVGTRGPEIIDQPGGATILPFPVMPPSRSFADGTPGWTAAAEYSSSGSGSSGDSEAAAAVRALEKKFADMTAAMTAEIMALRKQLQGGQVAQVEKADIGNQHLSQISKNVGPSISAPTRRAVG